MSNALEFQENQSSPNMQPSNFRIVSQQDSRPNEPQPMPQYVRELQTRNVATRGNENTLTLRGGDAQNNFAEKKITPKEYKSSCERPDR